MKSINLGHPSGAWRMQSWNRGGRTRRRLHLLCALPAGRGHTQITSMEAHAVSSSIPSKFIDLTHSIHVHLSAPLVYLLWHVPRGAPKVAAPTANRARRPPQRGARPLAASPLPH